MVGMNKAKRLSQNKRVGLLYKLYPPTNSISTRKRFTQRLYEAKQLIRLE